MVDQGHLIRERFQWRKVRTPIRWDPTSEGQELVGYYGGITRRDGKWGQYDCVLVHLPGQDSFFISGTKLVRLIHSSGVNVGHPIAIKWLGLVKTNSGKDMKDFELEVAQAPPVPVSALPE